MQAPKPGNVHVFAAGHGMEAKDFIDSAHVAAVPLATPGIDVGARIFAAVEATFARVGQNTNLGIILLCAPLAQAALDFPGEDLPLGVARVLKGLTRADAELAFKAIARANPGGTWRRAAARRDGAGARDLAGGHARQRGPRPHRLSIRS